MTPRLLPIAVAAATVAVLTVPCAVHAFTWSARTDVPGEQFGIGLHAGGVISNKIYIAGGGYIGSSLWGSYRSARVYDPTTDAWTTVASMPDQRTMPGSAVATFLGNPRLYVIGGMDLTDFPISHFTHNDIAEYDPAGDAWRIVGAGMPDGFSSWGACAVTLDNKIFIMGGVDDTFLGLSTRLASYDPDTDSYATLAAMPVGVSDGACAVVGRTIYWLSGYDEPTGWGALPQPLTFAYDVDLNSWSTLPGSMPAPRADAAGIAVGTQIYVVGGWDGSGTYPGMFNTTDVLDTTAQTWSGNVPGPLGCVADDGAQYRGRSGLTLHEANDGTAQRVFAVGGNIGISIPTRCNESAPRPSGVADTTAPDFTGLATTAESATCATPPAPIARLDWPLATDVSPPVVYHIYRGTSPSFLPDVTTLIASAVPAPPYDDILTTASCFQSYWYIVRAEDSASPPNQDTNTVRVQIDLTCPPPPLPADIGNQLLAVKDQTLAPVLDWSGYAPSLDVTHYHVRRTISKLGLPGTTISEPTPTTFTDTAASGTQYLYQVRAATFCERESAE